jgi:hypothetical protein
MAVDATNQERDGFYHFSDDIVHANLRRIPLGIGEGNWLRSLSEASHERIVVRNNDGWVLLLGMGGILALVGAIVLAIIYVPGMFNGEVRKPVQTGVGILSLFVFGSIGVMFLFGIGGRQIFDQKTRSFCDCRWETIRYKYEVQEGSHLVLAISSKDSDGYQNCTLELHNADCSVRVDAIEVIATQPSAGFVARLAGRVATMLNIPLRLRGSVEIEKGHPDLKLWWGLYQRLNETGKLELPEDFDQEGIKDYARTKAVATWMKVMVGMVVISMLSSFFIVTWLKALMWIGAQGIGLLIFFNGFNGWNTGEAEGVHGERFSGTKAKLVGAGQMLAGLIFIIGIPVASITSPEPKGFGYRWHAPIAVAKRSSSVVSGVPC